MLRWLIIFIALTLMISSCAKQLKENTTLTILDQQMAFSVGSGNNDEEYFHPEDSADLRNEIISDLTADFNGNNNVSVITDSAQYTLKIFGCSFDEWITYKTIADPCDSSDTPDSLHIQFHNLGVHMSCVLINRATNSFRFIDAEASDEEELKDGPTFLQSLFNSNCSCYEPHVKSIRFYNKLRNRVLRRIHRRAISQIDSWQEE